MRLLAPRNMGNVTIGGQTFEPDAKGILIVEDNVPVKVLEDLRSHGFADIPGRVDPGDDPELKLQEALAHIAELEKRIHEAYRTAEGAEKDTSEAEAALAASQKQVADLEKMLADSAAAIKARADAEAKAEALQKQVDDLKKQLAEAAAAGKGKK